MEVDPSVIFESREKTSVDDISNFALINQGYDDFQEFFRESLQRIIEEIDILVIEYQIIKVGVCLICKYKKQEGERIIETKLYFWCDYHLCSIQPTPDFNISDWFKDNFIDAILKKVRDFESMRSGWLFKEIVELFVKCVQYDKADARVEIENRAGAFENRVRNFALMNKDHIDPNEFFKDAFKNFAEEVRKVVEVYHIIKVAVCLQVEYERKEGENTNITKLYFRCDYEMCDIDVVDDDEKFLEWFQEVFIDELMKKMEEFEINGSGWTFRRISELDVICIQYDVLRGGTYIELCKFLKSKLAIINVRNNDEQCFKWAILSATQEPRGNVVRCNSYIDRGELNFTGINFPVQIKDIDKFEKLNPTYSVNVYMFDEDKQQIYPTRLTKNVKERHIHLMLISKVVVHNGELTKNTHYCWIKNMSRLLRSQVTRHRRTTFFCDRCLQHFATSEKVNLHTPSCMKRNVCRIDMPSPGEHIIYFKNYQNKLAVPFVIYADIESLLIQPTQDFCRSGTTKAYQEHIPFAIGYYFKSNFDQRESYYRSRQGADCIEWFVDEMYRIACELAPLLRRNVAIHMTDEDKKAFEDATDCHICERALENAIKVRDHCHMTGKYRGAAHSACNILYETSKTIPVIFHNLSGYDSHFIIREIGKTKYRGEISVIPINDQNYIAFTKTVDDANWRGRPFNAKNLIKLKFIDSFRFMASSLDQLAFYLKSEEKSTLRKSFDTLSPEDLALLERKGVFPYDYMDSWDKLQQTSLPTKDDFYSRLTESGISDADYQHAQTVWSTFQIKNLQEYAELYLKTDILLLADVFENFRSKCQRIYKLDPAHYFTAPGFSWDAMLKYTKVDIELLMDIDMHLFVEDGIRGGVSQCSTRYAKANNKYLDDYDETQKSLYLMYLDVNNLYGKAMTEFLPLKGFKWVDDVDIRTIMEIEDDSDTGYILKVDLEYPHEFHDDHADYPMCPETKTPPGGKYHKLLLTLSDKKEYVIHYKMLKFVLQHGMKLKRIHRAIKFEQSAWLQPYILLNTRERQKTTNDFEKNLYKLMSNAVYGKTMENLRSRVDIKLKNRWHGRYQTAELVAQPNFKKLKVFDPELVAIEQYHASITLNKPIIVGMSVLDISKVVMYDFHYDYMKPKYGENVQVLYTDTDSFVYQIECPDFYADMKNDIHKYDTSDFALVNPYGMPRENKKVPGLMKDENNGKIMTEFVGLRSKMYSVRVNNQDAMKKAKGVKKYVLKKTICFDDYLTCIDLTRKILREQNSIRSKNHNVFTIKQTKIALSGHDDKRHILGDGIHTLPHGHYSLIRNPDV